MSLSAVSTVPSAAATHPRSAIPERPRIGVVKLASCDGCQLTLLDLEDELLAIAERVDIVEFPEATSRRSSGPFDVLFVEGSVSAPEQVAEVFADYYDLGVSHFLIRGFDPLPDAIDYGRELIPLTRELIARRQAVRGEAAE